MNIFITLLDNVNKSRTTAGNLSLSRRWQRPLADNTQLERTPPPDYWMLAAYQDKTRQRSKGRWFKTRIGQ
jgi:hypothetical protein